MCSNNQSGVSPNIQRDSTPEHSPDFYQKLSRAFAPFSARPADELSCTLANISATCEFIQEITNELSTSEQVQIPARSIVGFSETIMRQVATVEVLHEELIYQHFNLEKSHQQLQQDLEASQNLNAEYRQQIKGLHQSIKKNKAVAV